MEKIKFDLSQKTGAFKILNATNGGPWHKRHANDQYRSNFEDYKAARIPYSRNHDSWFCSIYGGPFSHDITAIFPNFDADVNDETIKAIAQKQPYYFVMRDSSLANDSVATNFEQIFATYSPDTVRKVL